MVKHLKIVIAVLPVFYLLYRFFLQKTVITSLDKKGKRFLEVMEGVILKTYTDTKGNDTIGIGHLVLESEPHLRNAKITKAQVNEIFNKDFEIHVQPIIALQKAGVELNQHQFNALVSFVWNIGVSGFVNQSLLYKYLLGRKKNFESSRIRDYFDNWTYDGRREAEIILFNTGKYQDQKGISI